MQHFYVKAALSSAAFLFGLAGCATGDSFGNAAQVSAWANSHGFSRLDLTPGTFRLAAFARGTASHNNTLTVYIEGDGAPWATPYHPPRDPTPSNPMSLALATDDPAPAVVYLGRPCQYLDEMALQHCDSRYWTERRFSPEVIAAYDDALTQLKALFQFKHLRLIGYSGGGVIATLLADKRDDVELLITVAAPLAVSEWVAWHGLSPLTGSLDPGASALSHQLPPAIHFVGANDKIVPAAIVMEFSRHKGGRVVTIPGFDHNCCWTRNWPSLLKYFPVQEETP